MHKDYFEFSGSPLLIDLWCLYSLRVVHNSLSSSTKFVSVLVFLSYTFSTALQDTRIAFQGSYYGRTTNAG
jgi:hypothetical protein